MHLVPVDIGENPHLDQVGQLRPQERNITPGVGALAIVADSVTSICESLLVCESPLALVESC